MDLKISDLPPQFENIAIELGIDKIKALFKELFPWKREEAVLFY